MSLAKTRHAPIAPGIPAWVSTDLAGLRRQLVRCSSAWAGPQAEHWLEEDSWLTVSRTRLVEYNAAGTWSPEPARLAAVRDALEATGLPGYVLVAGPALGSVRQLVEAGWAVSAATRFMARPLEDELADDPAVTRLGPEELWRLRALVEETFRLGARASALSVPDAAAEEVPTPSGARLGAWALWEDGAVVSGLISATVDDAVSLWSMATAPDRQGRGLGRRLLTSVLARERCRGARRSVLIASEAGEHLYRAVGYVPLDYWQCWTKRRYLPPS